MATVGYARVSTSGQTLDQQHDALNAAGVDRIFDDVMSGARADRPGLAALLDYVRAGDTVTVVALDRLGRSTTQVLATMKTLHDRSIRLVSFREGLDFSTPVGKAVATIMISISELERELIKERAAAAREAARARGRQVGRKRLLDAAKVEQAQILRTAGQTIPEICQVLNVSRATLYRAFSQDATTDRDIRSTHAQEQRQAVQ
jgi:DNA invertase Pin-like site-specific DNA recombinase